MSKLETTSKVSLKLPSRINLEKQGTRAEFSTLDTTRKPFHKLERVNPTVKPPSRTNPGRRGARAKPSTLDTAHKLPPPPPPHPTHTALKGLKSQAFKMFYLTFFHPLIKPPLRTTFINKTRY